LICVATTTFAQTPTPVASTAQTEAAKVEPVVTPAANTQSEPGVPTRTRALVGIALKNTLTPGDEVGNSIKPSFIWKWRSKTADTRDRFAFAYGLNSYGTEFSTPFGGQDLPTGDLRLRPVMVGADYKMPRGKWQYSVGLQAGWAINSIEDTDFYRNLVRDATGNDDLYVDARNSFVWAPKAKATYDINRRFMLQFDGAYFVANPELIRRIGGVESRSSFKADALIVKAGILFGIF